MSVYIIILLNIYGTSQKEGVPYVLTLYAVFRNDDNEGINPLVFISYITAFLPLE